MSRHAPRRNEQGIRSVPPALEPQPAAAHIPAAPVEPGGQPEYMDRGWIIVQWLWPFAVGMLVLSEVGMFVFRKLTN